MTGPLYGPNPGVSTAYSSILKIRPGETVAAVCLSPAITGVWQHFMGTKSLPCYDRNGGACPFDHTKTSVRWCGWMPVVRGPGRPIQYVCLTPGAATGLIDLDAQAKLRGQTIEVSRSQGAANAKMWARPSLSYLVPARDLPKSPNVELWLARLWGEPRTWSGTRPEFTEALANLQAIYVQVMTAVDERGVRHA